MPRRVPIRRRSFFVVSPFLSSSRSGGVFVAGRVTAVRGGAPLRLAATLLGGARAPGPVPWRCSAVGKSRVGTAVPVDAVLPAVYSQGELL